MRCVRCGGDGRGPALGWMPSSGVAPAHGAPDDEADDDDEVTFSYSEFDAGLVCMACVRAALMSTDSPSSDSDLPTQDIHNEGEPRPAPLSFADGIALTVELQTMDAKLGRASQTLTPRGPVEEPACLALVDVAMQGLSLGRRLSGELYTADFQRLLYAKAALSLALKAVDKIPPSYNTAPRSVRAPLGTSWEEIAAAVVREYAYVCLAGGQWSQAAAVSRRLLEADGQRMTAEDLALFRRLCMPAGQAASPFHQALTKCPDFMEFRAGWLEQAARPCAQAADLLFAARARGPVTYAIFTSFSKDVRLWQHVIQSFAVTEDGLRCFGCGAASSDCICDGESACAVQPVRIPPPLEIEQKTLPNIGSAVMICGLSSAEGRPLNHCVGTVVALEASGRLRVRMFRPREGVEKAVKRECTRLTLLGPPFLDFALAEGQQRGSLHPHSLAWQAPPPSARGIGAAPYPASATNGSDEHSSAGAASVRADVSGHRNKPAPNRSRRRGGKAKGAEKTT